MLSLRIIAVTVLASWLASALVIPVRILLHPDNSGQHGIGIMLNRTIPRVHVTIRAGFIPKNRTLEKDTDTQSPRGAVLWEKKPETEQKDKLGCGNDNDKDWETLQNLFNKTKLHRRDNVNDNDHRDMLGRPWPTDDPLRTQVVTSIACFEDGDFAGCNKFYPDKPLPKTFNLNGAKGSYICFEEGRNYHYLCRKMKGHEDKPLGLYCINAPRKGTGYAHWNGMCWTKVG